MTRSVFSPTPSRSRNLPAVARSAKLVVGKIADRVGRVAERSNAVRRLATALEQIADALQRLDWVELVQSSSPFRFPERRRTVRTGVSSSC